MLANQAEACNVITMLPPQSYTAGANNGAYVDLSSYIGHAAFLIDVGSVTGSVIVKVSHATSNGGAGLADVKTTGSITTGDTAVKLVVPCEGLFQFVRVTATVSTGPVVMGVVVFANPQYS
jgi:hypothetical protein